MADKTSSATVDVICDLRQYGEDVEDIGTFEQLWKKVNNQLIGQDVTSTAELSLRLPDGNIGLWIVDSHEIVQIQADTVFRVVDVVRVPRLIYHCTVCGEYGPLRCTICDDAKRDTRLCADHAHTIKDELKAYCPEHVPHCECQTGCKATATFRCRRCHRLFGGHYHQTHPNDATVDYCHRCYRVLFERCVVPGCHNLGRSKCAFQTRSMSEPCGKPLCPEHSFQWKIWGPHNRGVALCESHKNLITTADPADLLYMMLHAQAPYVRRDRRASLPNPFRLRRILNRNRVSPLTFHQIGQSIRLLEGQVSGWIKKARENYYFFARNYFDVVDNLSSQETTFLNQIREFYNRSVNWSAGQQIVGVEIIDCYYAPGQRPRYRVRVFLSTPNKGLFIGDNGTKVNELEQKLNLKVEF